MIEESRTFHLGLIEVLRNHLHLNDKVFAVRYITVLQEYLSGLPQFTPEETAVMVEDCKRHGLEVTANWLSSGYEDFQETPLLVSFQLVLEEVESALEKQSQSVRFAYAVMCFIVSTELSNHMNKLTQQVETLPRPRNESEWN